MVVWTCLKGGIAGGCNCREGKREYVYVVGRQKSMEDGG